MAELKAGEPDWLNPVRLDKLTAPRPRPDALRALARRDGRLAAVMVAAAAVPGLVYHVTVASYVFSIVGALACALAFGGLCLARHGFARDLSGVAGVAFVGPAVVNLPLLLDEPVLYFAGFTTGALIPIALLAVGMTSTMRAEERRRAAWGAEWVSKAEARSAAEQAAMNFGKPIEGSAGGQR